MNTGSNRFSRIAFISVFAISLASGLDAPYLLKVETLSHWEVAVTWRNNSTSTQGFSILRKDPGEADFKSVAQVPGAQTSFIDTTVSPSTEYQFAVLAFAPGEHSDPSAIGTVTTAQDVIFKAQLPTAKPDPVHGRIRFTFGDRSRTEKGHRILKSFNGGPFQTVVTLLSDEPARIEDSIAWTDSLAVNLGWHAYKVETFNDSLSAMSDSAEAFLFRSDTRFGTGKMTLDTGTRLSEFPIKYGGWALWDGDSLFLKETDNPTGISHIDVHDPGSPKFSRVIETPIGSDESTDPGISQNRAAWAVRGRALIMGKATYSTYPDVVALYRYDGSGFRKIQVHDQISDFMSVYESGELLNDSVVLFAGYEGRHYLFRTAVFHDTGFVGVSNRFVYINSSFGVGEMFGIYENRIYVKVRPKGDLSDAGDLRILDYAHSPLAPKLQIINNFKGSLDIPKALGPYIYRNPFLKSAKQVFLDTLKGNLMVLTNDRLITYRYGLTPYSVAIKADGTRPVAAGRRFNIQISVGLLAVVWSGLEPSGALTLHNPKGAKIGVARKQGENWVVQGAIQAEGLILIRAEKSGRTAGYGKAWMIRSLTP